MSLKGTWLNLALFALHIFLNFVHVGSALYNCHIYFAVTTRTEIATLVCTATQRHVHVEGFLSRFVRHVVHHGPGTMAQT